MKYILPQFILFSGILTFAQSSYPALLQPIWIMDTKNNYESMNKSTGNFITDKNDSTYIEIPPQKDIVILIDGISGLNEWDNSLKIPLKEKYRLHLMADTDWLYVGVFSNQNMPYTDLFVKTDTELINLHASMQLAERLLPDDNSWNDEVPIWNWGNNTHWHANTVKYKIGATDSLPFRDQVEAYEGQEFKIAKDKLALKFSMLIVIRDFTDTNIVVSFPEKGNPYTGDSWQTYHFIN